MDVLSEVYNFKMRCFTNDDMDPDTWLVIPTGFTNQYVISLASPFDDHELLDWKLVSQEELKRTYNIDLDRRSLVHYECSKCIKGYTALPDQDNPKCPHCGTPGDIGDALIVMLAQQTFHMDDETAEKVVDDFIREYPEILKSHRKKFLYSI